MTNYAELGFYRVAAVSPEVHLADPARNERTLSEWVASAAAQEACVVVFPELAITGYTCEDLFHSQDLLDRSRRALAKIAAETAELPISIVVGAPYRTLDGRLYNAAFVVHRGAVRGAIPKIHLPNYGEFYEKRWFVSGGADLQITDELLGTFPLSSRQLFQIGSLVFAVEICEDLWAPIPPSCEHALAGANVIVNLSASNELVAKHDYRRDLALQQSARLNAAYVYASSGPTESTKDIVYGGHMLVAENGALLAQGERFPWKGAALVADVDVEKLLHERRHNGTFGYSPRPSGYTQLNLGPASLNSLQRTFPKTPFVPDDPATVGERAREILQIQSAGLARRLMASGSETAVIGVSGGLDSTLASIVAVEAMRQLGRPPSKVIGVSMPGPGTTERTKASASSLIAQLGMTSMEIPITAAVMQHFKDIGHDPSTHDLVFENTQARERTQILFDLANKHRGVVVGTGDMSELALGWCTYNADHMSNYSVNVSIPKTLVKHLVRWYGQNVADARTREVLEAILETVISPELLPPSAEGHIVQETEKVIGPFVLHDFFLFHHVRYGFGPRKIFEIASLTFDEPDLKRWLGVFFKRFYTQQFKRTCLPPGPKVGSVSLSPRGDWRMPDEVDPDALLREVESL